jgi:hypothetical protein
LRIHAIGDPHLSLGRPKPMDIFGPLWVDHPAKLAAAWDRSVAAEDVVLVVGDISWARRLEEAAPDLEYLASRRGALKVLIRGNHDSWWTSAHKVRAALPKTLAILHHDAIRLEQGVVLCGARGWNVPGSPWFDATSDQPIYERELARLDLSLRAAASLRQPGDALIALLHYPPVAPQSEQSEVSLRLERAQVDLAVYGHLHGEDHAWAPRGRIGQLQLRFVAADFTRFTPVAVWEQGLGVLDLDAPRL